MKENYTVNTTKGRLTFLRLMWVVLSLTVVTVIASAQTSLTPSFVVSTLELRYKFQVY